MPAPLIPIIAAAVSGGSTIAGGLLSRRQGSGARGRSDEERQRQIQQQRRILDDVALPNIGRAEDLAGELGANGGLNPQQQDAIKRLRAQQESMQQGPDLTGLQLPPQIQRQFDLLNSGIDFGRQRETELLQTGGFSGEMRQAFDRNLDLGTGRTSQQQTLNDLSNEIIGTRGRTAELDFMRDRSQDLFRDDPSLRAASNEGLGIIKAGGQTRELRKLAGQGNSLIASGGFTADLRRLEGQLQAQIQSGGISPQGQKLLGQLQPLIESGGQGGALLPMDVATGFARDQAVSAIQNQAEGARRQAFARGGGPGAVVASGLQNQALAEFADESARAEAGAVQQAALGQQGLQLQQLLGAAGISGGVIESGQGVVGSANQGLGNIANASSRNIATGAGLATSAQQLAAQRLGIGGDIFNDAQGRILGRNQLGAQLGMDVEQQVLDRLGMGTGIQQDLIGSMLTGMNQAGGIAINAGGRYDNSLERLQGLEDLRLGGIGERGKLRGQNLGAQRDSNNNLLRLLELELGSLQDGRGNQGDAADIFARLGLGGLNYAGDANRNAAQLAGNFPQGQNLLGRTMLGAGLELGGEVLKRRWPSPGGGSSDGPVGDLEGIFGSDTGLNDPTPYGVPKGGYGNPDPRLTETTRGTTIDGFAGSTEINPHTPL